MIALASMVKDAWREEGKEAGREGWGEEVPEGSTNYRPPHSCSNILLSQSCR